MVVALIKVIGQLTLLIRTVVPLPVKLVPVKVRTFPDPPEVEAPEPPVVEEILEMVGGEL
jgi:hypothetical protein